MAGGVHDEYAAVAACASVAGARLHTVAVDEAPAGDRAGARMRRWCGR